ncbi:RNA pseudouridine synthase [Helicobacter sp. 12S02634-8]|uniref:RluA family pseudouridine synthase n=1 Tax=Helicobacter sp. 12S02634-8 TaxID=1476199 RepID=UPI000BA58916|nr:RluA family pseudouridine synthase [Helicobacter sp. 12S02634-8]PAF47479.1 RNA pseudouridine synthase [Helicobacter sp. 12S02634-8]
MKKTFQIKDFYPRLDGFLSQELEISKSQVLGWIKSSLVTLNGQIVQKGGLKLKNGDCITLLPPPPLTQQHTPPIPQMDIDIIYEDTDILLLNKPPHLIIHKAPSVKEATLVDWLKSKGFALSDISHQERYGIVHRLDKDTSGAILIAKNNHAHIRLSEQLKNRVMGRYYLCVITPPLLRPSTIECQLGRHPNNRLKMTNLDRLKLSLSSARYSKSQFVPLLSSKNGALSLLCAKLFTGRTHQIRAHLESISRHIIGDKLYGTQDTYDVRMLLHAYLIYFSHPRTGKKMFFKVPVFDDMLEFLVKNFDKVGLDAAIREDQILRSFDTF